MFRSASKSSVASWIRITLTINLNNSTSILKPPLSSKYQDGEIDGIEKVYIKGEKVVLKKEIFKGGSWSWNKGIWHQYA